MIWTVLHGDSPMSYAKEGLPNVTKARSFETREDAKIFAQSCRIAGQYADVQEHGSHVSPHNGKTE